MIMLSSKISGLRQLSLISCDILKYKYNSYRNYNKQDQKNNSYQSTHNYRQNYRRDTTNKKLFRTFQKINKKNQQFNKTEQQTNIQDYVKTINQINQQFLGIKLNTDYFKIYNQKKIQDILKPDHNQSYKLHDLPFNIKSKNQLTQNSIQQSQLPLSLATKMLKKMIKEQRLIKQMKVLVRDYFKDLVTRQRNSRMEPNFQMYARKVVETLKSKKTSIKLANIQSNPKIVLKNVTMFKGVKVNRNDNYSLDSYKINYQEEQQNIITYTLFKKEREQYPQNQWFAQRFIMARIQAQVSNGPVIEVVQQNSLTSSNKGVTHSFVFQANLLVPPALSALSLSPEQFANSYRLKPEHLQISNVDNKNIYFNLAFKQEDKKNKLINKII